MNHADLMITFFGYKEELLHVFMNLYVFIYIYNIYYIWAHPFTEISLQLYEDELLHALPCAAPPSYTEYRSDAPVKVTGNGNKNSVSLFDNVRLLRDRVLSMARDLLQFRAICAKSRHWRESQQ